MFDQPHFRKSVLQTFGSRGQEWLANLPALVTTCCQRWSISLGQPFLLSYNFVAPGLRSDGTPVVLKTGVPNPELLSEMAALRIYGGQGAARLLEEDADLGAMLLEHILPGQMLSHLEDDAGATRIIASVMRRLWRPLSPEQASLFPDLTRWLRALFRLELHSESRFSNPESPSEGTFATRDGALFTSLLEQARVMATGLLSSQGEIVLLHGDLHHDNILSAGREPWLAVDPKGVAGEREFEVGPMMYNPWQRVLDDPDLKSVLSRRLDILVEELGLDRQRLLAWSFVEAALSMAWSLEDHDPYWDRLLPLAKALLELF